MKSKTITIIYPYRNRDLKRVKNSLKSLSDQSNMNFEVFFVNYGSSPTFSEQVKELCSLYDFVNYRFCPTQFQPWNKSRALNSVVKELTSDFCFVADIDMIFHPEFIRKAIQIQEPDKTVYFQVGFLSPNDIVGNKKFKEFRNFRKSTFEATGLSMFPLKILQKLRGFDEFYHFWGAEDTDMHVRIKNSGYEVEFYEEEVLMLHQWHPSYRSSESGELSRELQISGIVQLNHHHLKHVLEYKTTSVNRGNWGECITLEELNELEKAPVNFVSDNEQRKMDHLLYVVMPEAKNEILKITIKKDSFQGSPKFSVKKLMGKKVPEYYTLKQINDKVLLHIISFYRDRPYTFKISEDLQEIEIAIKF